MIVVRIEPTVSLGWRDLIRDLHGDLRVAIVKEEIVIATGDLRTIDRAIDGGSAGNEKRWIEIANAYIAVVEREDECWLS